jgi:hypothetical protein
LLILASCLAGYAIIYSILTSHLVRGEYLRLENKFFELEFPKSWFAVKWESINETSGNIYSAFFAHPDPDLEAVIIFRVFDEKATRTYMRENGLKDAFSAVIFEVKRFYDWTLQSSANATLHFEKNGTVIVSSCEADYALFSIKNGLRKEDVFLNATGIFVSWISQQRIIQVMFYGEENDWKQTYDSFTDILNSIKV